MCCMARASSGVADRCHSNDNLSHNPCLSYLILRLTALRFVISVDFLSTRLAVSRKNCVSLYMDKMATAGVDSNYTLLVEIVNQIHNQQIGCQQHDVHNGANLHEVGKAETARTVNQHVGARTNG